VNLSIGVGKRDGIRPADIVGSIANEADVPGREIGPIDIREDVTIVGIPEKYKDQVLEKTARAKFRGRPLNVRVASASEGAAARPARAAKPFAPRDRDAAPRERSSRPFVRRDDEAPRDRVVRAYQRDENRERPAPRPYKRDDAPRERSAAPARAERAPYRSTRPAAGRDERPGGYRSERPSGGGFAKKTFGAPAGDREKRSYPPKREGYVSRGPARSEGAGGEGPKKKFFSGFAGGKSRDSKPAGRPPFKKKPR
jgi:hypothetical protein